MTLFIIKYLKRVPGSSSLLWSLPFYHSILNLVRNQLPAENVNYFSSTEEGTRDAGRYYVEPLDKVSYWVSWDDKQLISSNSHFYCETISDNLSFLVTALSTFCRHIFVILDQQILCHFPPCLLSVNVRLEMQYICRDLLLVFRIIHRSRTTCLSSGGKTAKLYCTVL